MSQPDDPNHSPQRFPHGIGFVLGCAIAAMIVVALLYKGGAFDF